MISSDLRFRTVAGLLRCRAAERPEREAFLFLAEGELEGARLTYGELDRRARAIAQALRESLEPGDRALLLVPPGLDFIAAFFGCLYAGVVAVPAYPPRPDDRSQNRLRTIARDAEPRAALTTSALCAAASGPQGFASGVPELAALRWIATDVLEGVEASAVELAEPDPESVAFLQYTSGSTATPKGVMVSHANLLHNERMIGEAFAQDEDSIVVGWLPLYHDMGLIGNVLQPLHAGARCVLMSPAAFLQRPRRWLEAIGRYRGTTSGGPSFAYELCVRKVPPEEREGLDLSSWRVAFNGAEPVRAETLERFAEAFAPCGFRREAFYPCYGLAEATLFVTGGVCGRGPRIERLDAQALERHELVRAEEGEPARLLVSCGRAWHDQRIAIADPETGAELPPGRVGEIRIAGPSVARGYWRNPEATERDFRARLASGEEQFLRTGDLGFLLGGELYVTGRIKDLVIVHGRNHYPQDLELTAERSHPDLRPGAHVVDELGTGGLADPDPIRPVPRGPAAALALSFAQERLWVLDRLHGGSAVYNVPLLVRLRGVPALPELAAAFEAVVHRHESLRTTFTDRDGEPVQVVAPVSPASRGWPLPLVDLSGLPAPAREREARTLAEAEARQRFNLATGPLLRTTLLRLAAEDHRLLVNVHHIAADGWSMGLLVRELEALYGALRSGAPPQLPELPVQYADFAAWQRRRLCGEVLEREISWWREQLRGLSSLDLPTDQPRPIVPTWRGDEVPLDLGPALSGDLIALARREGATPFMALLAGVSALLSGWSGQRDLAVGSPVAGRDRPEIQDLIGFFVNTLVLRSDLSDDLGFRGLLQRVREVALDAYAHQELPFEKLVDALQPQRDLSRGPLFQVALALQNAPLPPLELTGLNLEALPLSTGTAKVDLTFNLREEQGVFAGTLEFAADLFDRVTALRLNDRLRDLLQSAVADPDSPLSRLAAFPEAERRQLVAAASAPQPPGPEAAAYVPPRDELERTLCAAWREVLGRERIGVRESFFELGGNSLAMIRLHSRLCQVLGREIDIATLFQHPTIKSLAQHLAEPAEPAEDTPRPEEDARERTELRRQTLRQLQQARGHLRRHRSSRGNAP